MKKKENTPQNLEIVYNGIKLMACEKQATALTTQPMVIFDIYLPSIIHIIKHDVELNLNLNE